MASNFEEFEDTEENKFIYTDIFKQYVHLCSCVALMDSQTDMIESSLNHSLKSRISGFKMEEFIAMLP